MTEEQVWEDLSRFAQAMKRGATVVFNNGQRRPDSTTPGKRMDFEYIKMHGGIREIIEPTQKKVRPLNAEEWPTVAGCIICVPHVSTTGGGFVELSHCDRAAQFYTAEKATCHPPGFPSDVRKLWVEE